MRSLRRIPISGSIGSVFSWWSILAAAAFLLFGDGGEFAFATTTTAENVGRSNNNSAATTQSNKNSKIITFPLIPHHVVQQRRMLEKGDGISDVAPKVEQQRPHHYPRSTRYLNHENDPDAFTSNQVAGLYQGYGTHYADLWCGKPPQRQTVIVDTGSGVTAFPCSGCKNCGVPDYHIDNLFQETESSTFRKLSCSECLRGNCHNSACSMGMSYQEGSSWNAYEALDSCYVGGAHDKAVIVDDNNPDDMDPFHAPAFAFDMKFGCQTKITGLFKTQLADGIMGMDVANSAFWWQMYDAKKIDHKAFSMCFSRKDEASRDGTESGAMSLGGVDTRLHNTPLVYTEHDSSSSGFYVVHIRKMYLRKGGGGISALSNDDNVEVRKLDLDESALNSGRVIVDSGTTDTYFSRKLGKVFKSVFEEMSGYEYGHGSIKSTLEELGQNFPTILFQFSGDTTLNQGVLDRHKGEDGATPIPGLAGDLDPDHPLDVILAIPPEHYFEYDPDKDGYVSRFYVDEGSGGVIGANSMMGHDVYFDAETYHLGWAESDCDYTKLASPYQDKDSGKKKTEPPKDTPSMHSKAPAPAPKDDEGSESNDEPSGKYPNVFDKDVCSGLTCQVSVLAIVVFSVAFVAVKLVRRASAGPAYDLAQSELELQTTDDNFDDSDDMIINNGRTNGSYHDSDSAEIPDIT